MARISEVERQPLLRAREEGLWEDREGWPHAPPLSEQSWAGGEETGETEELPGELLGCFYLG